jgi:N-acetylneuraminate 9-O-acetyltransferase
VHSPRYHYFHAEDTYNAIRVMITCYVWMTGFGNFSFFYMKRDFGAVRLLQMMWRLNFLVLFLCLAFGNTYILYYICPLHTCFFLMVYAAMRIKQDVNHTQWGVRIKLAVLGLLIFLVWDLPFTRLYDVLFSWWMNETGYDFLCTKLCSLCFCDYCHLF